MAAQPAIEAAPLWSAALVEADITDLPPYLPMQNVKTKTYRLTRNTILVPIHARDSALRHIEPRFLAARHLSTIAFAAARKCSANLVTGLSRIVSPFPRRDSSFRDRDRWSEHPCARNRNSFASSASVHESIQRRFSEDRLESRLSRSGWALLLLRRNPATGAGAFSS